MSKLPPELENSLASYRKARGLTQGQLAQAARVSRQTIVAIERGDYSPSTVLALRLALLLDTVVEQLFALPAESRKDLLQRRQQFVGMEQPDE